ncbi:MAG: YcgN family cysteine cluster protein [Acidiferrobacterales bacterium]|nr:YcgN family cysteine cluster protein [Acidiferrobacterales bacterium]
MQEKPFWRTKQLYEMTHSEWESVCDGCAKCCLTKLQDEETQQVVFTDVACQFLDADTCRCRDYKNRNDLVPDCVSLTPENITKYSQYLPSSCSYRLLLENKSLPDWHHLVSGKQSAIHQAGLSVKGRVRYKHKIDEQELENYVVDWC